MNDENSWIPVSPKSTKLFTIHKLQQKIKKNFVGVSISEHSKVNDLFFDNIKYNIFNEGYSQIDNPDILKLYHNLLQFSYIHISKLHEELSNNTGEILQIHTIPNLTEDITKQILQLKDYYRNNYIDVLTNKSKHYSTITGNIYPNYKADIYERAWDVIKDKYAPMMEKNDSEMKQIFKKRIDGLQTCSSTKTNIIANKKEYYTKYYPSEYEREYNLNQLLSSNTKLSDEEYNIKMCENIIWGHKTLGQINKPINPEYLKELLSNSVEVEFLKTFLPLEFFKDGNIDIEKIKSKQDWSDFLPYRQTIFGFSEDLYKKIYDKIPQLYQCLHIQNNYHNIKRCSDYVEWCQMLNNIYTYCAQKKNNSLFPIRFLLSDSYYKGLNIPFDTKNLQIHKLESILSNYQFIGILSIKYRYESTNTKRFYIILLFKLINKPLYYNALSGDSFDILLMNLSSNLIHYGDLFKRNPITHTEFKDLFFNYPNLSYFISQYNANQIFISNRYKDKELTQYEYSIISQLNMTEIKPELIKDKYDIHKSLYKLSKKQNKNIIYGGGSITLSKKQNKNIIYGGGGITLSNFKLETSKKYNLYNNTIINTTQIYSDFIDTNIIIYDKFGLLKINDKWTWDYLKYNILIQYLSVLYNYILVDLNSVNIGIRYKETNKLHIYQPITISYYHEYELYKQYDIFKNIKNTDKIIVISYSICFMENILKNRYNADVFIIKNHSQYMYLDIINKYIKTLKTYSKKSSYIFVNNNTIYELIDYEFPKCKLLHYNIINQEFDVGYIFGHPNIFNNFIGMLLALKLLESHGTFILYIDSIIYKENADIFLILKKYFKTVHIFTSELYLKFKMGGISLVCQDFKGIQQHDLSELMNMYNKMKKLYPRDILDFYVYDEKTRKKLLIETKSIDNIRPYITGLLNTKITDNIYDEIRNFNDKIYLERKIFCDTLVKLIDTYPIDKLPSIPSKNQIIDSILYCKKYDIEYYDKYNTKLWNDEIGLKIITEMYGSIIPINYNFKTVSKITLKQLKTNNINNANISDNKFSNLFDFKNINTKKSKKKKSPSNKNISLLKELITIEKQLYNTGLLIDNRRDFSIEDPAKQTYMYDDLKNRFRYYKGKRGINRLDMLLMKRLGVNNINQGYIKMYEILSECNIIPKKINNNIYRTYHFCELPGGFINCINNYIYTKTNISRYEWIGSSLSPKLADITDDYNFLNRYPNNWDFGCDNTGDITNIKNINFYMQKCKKFNPHLITSDCGLSYGNPKYELVAFASLLAILYCLPNGGSFIYKVMTPIELPLIYNLIYLCYKNFMDMIIFKPTQNSQSREFYLICKNYKTSPSLTVTLEKMLKYLEICKSQDTTLIEKEDIFNDKYSLAFVYQMKDILSKLADNFSMSIRRIIYIQDNLNELDENFLKILENYIYDKNEEWIHKYKISKSVKEL